MREYSNVPNPDKDPHAFNHYLLVNNEVIEETLNWILIENSFISGQRVAFAKRPIKYLWQSDLGEFAELKTILKTYADCHVYINADKDKSVPNRLHLHIKA